MAQANARKESGVMKTTGGRSHPTVAFISDSASDAIGEKTGVGRYVHALRTGIGKAGFDVVGSTPTLPSVLSPAHRILRLLRRYNYPLWSSYPDADIYHLTTQELGSLLILRRPKGPVVVTVHDIFPYMLRHDPELLSFLPGDRLYVHVAMAGLRRADRLITVSEHSKACVVEHLGIRPEKITTIHEGVDRDRFRPQPVPATIRERYGLPEGRRYLICVGTEDRRKNLPVVVRALAKLRRRLPDVELIKVGRPHRGQERPRLLELASELGIRPATHFLDDVPEDDLPLLYNLADVYVTASLYEGFGLPVLEAMACGTPVVCAKAGSLPEIAGNAALQVSPCNVETLAEAVVSVLESDEQRLRLHRSGQEQAARFTWATTIQKTAAVYRQL